MAHALCARPHLAVLLVCSLLCIWSTAAARSHQGDISDRDDSGRYSAAVDSKSKYNHGAYYQRASQHTEGRAERSLKWFRSGQSVSPRLLRVILIRVTASKRPPDCVHTFF